MIISAWECKCKMYNPKVASNLQRNQSGRNSKATEIFYTVNSVKVFCKSPDCNKSKIIKVVGA